MILRLLLMMGLLMSSSLVQAAPAADAWNRWAVFDDASELRVDHSSWDRLLATYRRLGDDGVARFAYGQVTTVDRVALNAYLDLLGGTPVKELSRNRQLAFWVNLYNALTVRVILDHYPIASIRDIDISPGWFADGPWSVKLINVDGTPVSLDDIEHRILRPLWREPRIHYLLNCASLGCPNLLPRALSADRLGESMNAAANAFVNHPRGARLEDDKLIVSSIYDWFSEDFGGSDLAVLAHLRRHAAPPLKSLLRWRDKIDDNAYDWRLNDAVIPAGEKADARPPWYNTLKNSKNKGGSAN